MTQRMKKFALMLLLLSAPMALWGAPGDGRGDRVNFDSKKEVTVKNTAGEDIKQLVGDSFKGFFNEDGTLAEGAVPIEAKVGKFFMAALSEVSRAIYSKLRPFLNALVICLFMFWVFMEAWWTLKITQDSWDLAERVLKRGIWIAVLTLIMNNDPARIFMVLAGPMITVGVAMSKLIMDGTVRLLGTNLPDTCAAIREWLRNDTSMIISGAEAADLLCIPTRAAAYFYTFVWTGLKWMAEGLFAPKFLLGAIFVLLFIYNIWKFALTALGVITDLFFVLLFLPFTIVSECFPEKDTKYNGFFKPVWTSMASIVQRVALKDQIQKFVSAVIYFIVLSIVSTICVILISGTNQFVYQATGSSGADSVTVLIIGCLVAYLMNRSEEIAKKIEATIDASAGERFGSAIVGMGKSVYGFGKKVVGTIGSVIKGAGGGT